MTFASPLALVGLVIVPLLLGGYLWQLRRQRRNAVRFSSVALVRQAVPKRSRWRRHVPIGLFLVGAIWSGVTGWVLSDYADQAPEAQPSS